MKRYIKRILSLVIVCAVLAAACLNPVSSAAQQVYELAFENIFVFEQWANNTLSGAVNSHIGSNAAMSKDIAAGSFTITNNFTTEVYTGHSMDPNPAGNTSYYTMGVEPNTQYTFSYNVSGSVTSFETFVFVFDSSDAYTTLFNHSAANHGANEWTFITPSNAHEIQVRFDVNNPGDTATVKDIRICKSEVYEYASQLQTRKSYTYSSSATYGTLPVPEKDGFVFAGWFTGENGTGDHITADTAVDAMSKTVYSKWDRATSGITIVSSPVKLNYDVGEKLNTTGLQIEATYLDGSTQVLESGFTCTPSYLTQIGTQTVTVSYGGSTATFTVNVKEGANRTVVVNNTDYTVTVKNNVYTLNCTADAFNRFELTYSSDAYVKGTVVMGSASEDFFLEPSSNGKFASFIDDFFSNTTRSEITSISFTPLDKAEMDFTLFSVDTTKSNVPGNMIYLSNSDYKIGVNLSWGGALSYLEDLKNNVMSSVHKYVSKRTKVDYADRVNDSILYRTSSNVNLINCNDTGRLVQQSYYGTDTYPYEPGVYQNVNWPYNPVQGGNLYNEASKIVDYQITDDSIYIKCRPLDWAKSKEYITPSYMEAWYTLEDGRVKGHCRFVDYSGYPSRTTTQEFPAFYCVEPFNNFIYYTGGEAWTDSNQKTTLSNLEFWGDHVDQRYDCNENWGAFIGEDADSFGIGIYAPAQTEFFVGVFGRGDTETVDPATESATSYIGVVDTIEFKSYNPTSYVYYITTGNIDQIRSSFSELGTSGADDCNVGYTDGFCNMCSRYQQPELTTDKYDVDADNVFDSVYEIYNPGQLYWFASQVNEGNTDINAILMNDIIVNENVLVNGALNSSATGMRQWAPIGNSSSKYQGVFNGNNKTISGLYNGNLNANGVGLFGYIGSDGKVKNVALDDSYFGASEYAGCIAAYCEGQVTASYANATIVGINYIGGMFGSLSGTVENCYFSGNLSSNSASGGIAATIASGASVTNCYYDKAKYSGNISHTNSGNLTEVRGLYGFAEGEATYMLNRGVTDGTQLFYQNIGTDSSPRFSGATVYCGYADCKAQEVSYSNTKLMEQAGHRGGTATCASLAICDICAKTYGSTDKENHTGETEIRNAVQATETKNGYTGDTHCAGCGEKFADGEIIPATGIQDPSRYVFADNGAVIDYTKGYIFGLRAGLDSLDGYVSFSDENCNIKYEPSSSGFGTGVKAIVSYEDNAFAEYTVVIFGDIDGNGWYDADDAFLANLMATGAITRGELPGYMWKAADCNHDGTVDELDVELLMGAGVKKNDIDQDSDPVNLVSQSAYIEYSMLIDQTAGVDVQQGEEITDSADETELQAWLTHIFVLLKKVIVFVLSFVIK